MEHGKPQKQALAIAYAMKRRKKMAEGGVAKNESNITGSNYGGFFEKMKAPPPPPPPKYAKGGNVYGVGHGVHGQVHSGTGKGGSSEAGLKAKHAKHHGDIIESRGLHKEKLEELREMPNPKLKGLAHGGFVEKEKASGYLDMPEDGEKENMSAEHESAKKLGQHGAHEQGPVPCEYEDEESLVDRIMHKKSVDESQMARLAYGGEAGDGMYEDDEQSLVDRIMHQHSDDEHDLDRYSRGGQVANQEHGENNNELAGFSPNEFDDLVLRDDLESSYGDDDNSGDAIGNEQEDQDRHDIVARILRSQKKKDKLPRPA
jgi:hypothetical protein